MESQINQVRHYEKQFRPKKIPRYLPGSTSDAEALKDLVSYNRHLFNVHTIKPVIDDKPPYMSPLNYATPAKLIRDYKRLGEIQQDNKELLCKINMIYKTQGFVDCWNHYKPVKPKWKKREQMHKKIVKKNKEIYKELKTIKPNYSKAEDSEYWKKMLVKLSEMCKYPLVITTKETVDDVVRKQPPITGDYIHYGYKPRVFIDFKLKDGTCVGEIIIELYPDFCPKTVKNFLTYCNPENTVNYKNCRIFNAKIGKFFETGDVTLNNGKGGTSIYGKSFTEEYSVLRHSRIGVVSTVRVREKGEIKTDSKFCISLCAAEELQNRCTVFGTVTKGNHILKKMNNFFKRAGPPYEPIIIQNCGIIPPTKLEIKTHEELKFEEQV